MAEAAGNPEYPVYASAQRWALALVLVSVYLSNFYETIPLIRYLKYATLPVLVLLYVGSLKDIRHPVVFVNQYTLPFLILLLAYAIFLPRINFTGIKDMLFISCFLVYFVLFDNKKVNIRLVNSVLLMVFATVVLWREGTRSLSIIDGSAFAESIMSLVFGLFAVFALVKRRYFWFLINVAALILSLKRIALLGVLAVLLVMLLPRALRKIVTSPVVAVSVNLLVVASLLALGSGVIDDFFADRYISLSTLSMGRSNFYAEVSERFLANPTMIALFGAGPGGAYDTLGIEAKTLHSDVLKIFYDLGGIWFIAFFYSLYAVSDLRLRMLALYLNVIFITDNALIYVDVMVFYMLLAAQLSLPDSSGESSVAAGGAHADHDTVPERLLFSPKGLEER